MVVNGANVGSVIPQALWTLLAQLGEKQRLVEQLEQVARCAAELTGSDHADITLFDTTLRRFVPLRSTLVFIHQGEPDAAARVREEKRAVIVPDLNFAASDEDMMLFNRDVASYMAVPLYDGRLIDGALVIFNRDARNYDAGEQQVLEGLASLAAVALRQKRLTQGLEDASRTLLKLSLTDPLTGIATGRQFEQMLRHEWQRAMHEGVSISLAQVEIDGLREVAEGDREEAAQRLLGRTARTLRAALYRAGDMVALLDRYRLAIILPETDRGGAAAIGKRLQRDAATLSLGAERGPMTLSIGISSFDTLLLHRGHPGNPDRLLEQAAAALEKVQRAGGNGLQQLELEE